MADNNLYVHINTDLLEEAKTPITLIFDDGNNLNSQLIELAEKAPYTNPYQLDLSSFLPNIRVLTLTRFFELTKDIIDKTSSSEGRPTIPLIEEYPPVDMAQIGNELITFRVINREPANMSTDGRSRPQRRDRFSYFIKDVDVGENIILVKNRPLDHEIELTVWSTQNKIANKRVEWLENLLVHQAWAYRESGADRFYFKKRLSDGYMTTGSQRIFYRPLRFFLRFNDFSAFAYYSIKNIELAVSLESGV